MHYITHILKYYISYHFSMVIQGNIYIIINKSTKIIENYLKISKYYIVSGQPIVKTNIHKNMDSSAVLSGFFLIWKSDDNLCIVNTSWWSFIFFLLFSSSLYIPLDVDAFYDDANCYNYTVVVVIKYNISIK